MSMGTRSLLFGYHQFLIHPLILAIAWTKLFGFPKDYRLWIAFLVHDFGYFGKPELDGPEGETHPYFGARLMHAFFGGKVGAPDHLDWYNFMLYHSRFLARKAGKETSKLCQADKMAIIICPTWLQVFLMSLTGEIHEYRKGQDGRTSGEGMTRFEWVEAMKSKLREWFVEQSIPKNSAIEPEWIAVKDDPRPGDKEEFWRVRWSKPNSKGEYLYVRHYGGNGSDWNRHAAERNAKEFNTLKRFPWEHPWYFNT